MRRGAVRAAGPLGLFLLFLIFSLQSPPAIAGIIASYHNFSGKAFAPYGACSACHLAHYAAGPRLWPRLLAQESSYFDQADAPNYVPGGTIFCYDCHVDYITNASGASPDNDPSNSNWSAGEEPQDIAFSDGPESPPATSATGYYELVDGTVSRSGTNDPPTPPLLPPVTEPTGGHFWKGVNDDTPGGGYSLGDKLDCLICHDPHDAATGVGVNRNEAMLREFVNGPENFSIGTSLPASLPPSSRNGTGTGREMCAACHQYSNAGAAETLFGVEIPIPPVKPSFDGHLSTDSEPCVKCHPHNSPDCGGCHGNPPPVAAAGYSGINENLGPHPKHALDDPDTSLVLTGTDEYNFDCLICHNDWPNSHDTTPGRTYQDVQFDYDDPDPVKNPSTDINSYNPGSRVCANLYCHSRGTGIADTLNNSGGSTVTWTAASWDTNDLGCEACHGEDAADGGPRPLGGSVRYGAPGYDNTSPKANSHDKHAYACKTCHYNVIRDDDHLDGWTIFDESLHVSNDSTTFTYNVDPDATAPLFGGYTYDPAGGTCTLVTCHGSGVAYDSIVWGSDNDCEDCHLAPVAPDTDNFFLFDDTISQISTSEWNNTGHGRSSGWFPWPANYTTGSDGNPIGPPSLTCLSSDPNTPVGGCHIAEAPHRLLQNPFRLATPNNGGNWWFESPSGGISQDAMNEFCWLCHDVEREQTHGQAETSGDWGDPLNAALHYKCIDCHDPHGDSNDYMIHDRPFADSSVNNAYVNYGIPSRAMPAVDPGWPDWDSGWSGWSDLPGGGIQGPIGMNVTEPDQEQANYVDLSGGSSSHVCQVCHQANNYFTQSMSTASHNAGVDCIHCHPHNKGIQPLCEVCHSEDTIYRSGHPDWPGGDDAPQVMGDGVDPVGTNYPFDDGSWGYNVNGHGAVGVGGLSCAPVFNESGDLTNPGCHDISIPSGTHLDGTLNTYSWFGKGADTTNSNTSHLMVTYSEADGFFAGVSPGSDYEYQTFFDNSCAGTNRDPGKSTRCHPADVHRHEMAHGDDVMRFGDHSTTANPKQDRSPTPYWTPWTIQDLSTDVAADFPAGPYFGTCVSCHDPHGTDPNIVTDNKLGSNLMLRHNWKLSAMGYFCNSMCHTVP